MASVLYHISSYIFHTTVILLKDNWLFPWWMHGPYFNGPLFDPLTVYVVSKESKFKY